MCNDGFPHGPGDQAQLPSRGTQLATAAVAHSLASTTAGTRFFMALPVVFVPLPYSVLLREKFSDQPPHVEVLKQLCVAHSLDCRLYRDRHANCGSEPRDQCEETGSKHSYVIELEPMHNYVRTSKIGFQFYIILR